MDAREEVIAKVTAHVNEHFGGSFRDAFTEMDRDHDERINATELNNLLAFAGVGNRLTRSAWVRGVIQEMDQDHDQMISWDEFAVAINAKS